MNKPRGFRFVAGLAAALALALGTALAPQAALAAVSSVKTATVTPSYSNPATGQIEDSGGASNQALGESMVTSTTDPHALVETDTAGKTYITLRVHLADGVTGLAVETSTDGGNTFAAAQTTKMQEDLSHGELSQDNTADWRFEAPSADSVMRVKMDVAPMGRAVTFFVKLSDLVDGNSAGFVQSVTPGEGSDDAAASSGDASQDSGSDSKDSEGSDDAKKADSTDDLNSQSGKDSGISEYNADGNKVNDDGAKPLEGGTVAIIVAVAVAVVAVAGGIYYAVVVRPKRAKQAAAAAAAASDPSDDTHA